MGGGICIWLVYTTVQEALNSRVTEMNWRESLVHVAATPVFYSLRCVQLDRVGVPDEVLIAGDFTVGIVYLYFGYHIYFRPRLHICRRQEAASKRVQALIMQAHIPPSRVMLNMDNTSPALYSPHNLP